MGSNHRPPGCEAGPTNRVRPIAFCPLSAPAGEGRVPACPERPALLARRIWNTLHLQIRLQAATASPPSKRKPRLSGAFVERTTGLEPATLGLGSQCSTS
jgi:hypothetical protein